MPPYIDKKKCLEFRLSNGVCESTLIYLAWNLRY